MKEFKSVSVKNFFSFGQKEQTLDLSGKGLWNINAANGYGKTTICVEAVTFAIYGKHREEKVDDCVNRYIKKNCKVSLEFIGDDDKTYKIIRYRKHDTHNNSVYLFKEDKDISCKNSKDTHALIQDYIGMPYLAFINSTIFSSELYSNFLSAKNSERLTIFENILSLKEVSMFYVATKDILKEINDKEVEIKIKYSEKNTEIETLKNSILEYTSQAKEKLISLKKQKEDATKQKEDAEKELKTFDAIDIDSERQKLSNKKLIDEYISQKNSKEKEVEGISAQQIILCGEKDKANDIYEKYNGVDFNDEVRKEKEYESKLEDINKYSAEISDIGQQIILLNSKIQISDMSITSLNKEKEELESKLEKVSKSICPFCGNEMNKEETEKKRKEIENKISEISDKLLKENSAELISEKDELTKKSNKLVEENNKRKENNKKDFIDDAEICAEKYNYAAKKIKDIDDESEKNKIKKQQLEEEAKELEEKIKVIPTTSITEDDINNFESKKNSLKKIISDSEIIISTVNGSVSSAYDKKYVEKIKENILLKEKDFENNKKELNDIEEDKKYYEILSDCFSNKSGGFKKYFIGQMIDIFNEKVNLYLPFFFKEKVSINFDMDLIDTIKMDDEDITFESFSRGQKTRAEIAVAFALFSVSRIFFSNKSGLLVVDELLDNGLDEYGIKSAISVLDSFAQDAKVYVVSHNPVVKENINNVIEIKKDENGFSYIA